MKHIILILLVCFIAGCSPFVRVTENSYANSFHRVHDLRDASDEMKSHLSSWGTNTMDTLNATEGEYLNYIFDTSAKGSSLTGKRIAVLYHGLGLVNKSVFFNAERDWYLNYNSRTLSSLFLFTPEQKLESGGYDAAILVWYKMLPPVELVVKGLSKRTRSNQKKLQQLQEEQEKLQYKLQKLEEEKQQIQYGLTGYKPMYRTTLELQPVQPDSNQKTKKFIVIDYSNNALIESGPKLNYQHFGVGLKLKHMFTANWFGEGEGKFTVLAISQTRKYDALYIKFPQTLQGESPESDIRMNLILGNIELPVRMGYQFNCASNSSLSLSVGGFLGMTMHGDISYRLVSDDRELYKSVLYGKEGNFSISRFQYGPSIMLNYNFGRSSFGVEFKRRCWINNTSILPAANSIGFSFSGCM